MASLPELLRAVNAAEVSGDPHRLRAARGRLHRRLRDTLPTDPLLAASCAAAVGDDELRAACDRIASAATPRSASALGLVVDHAGQGLVVEVVVALQPGGSGTWTPQNAERDALVAAQLAVAVALGSQAERFGVRWQVRGSRTVRGTSLGLALAVAARAALRGQSGPEDQAFTGGVDLDGRVASVFGVPAKVRAAAEAGLSQVTVPAAELVGLRVPDGLAIDGASAAEPMLEALFGTETAEAALVGRFQWRWLAVFLPPVLAWTGATDVVDGPLQGAAARAALGELAPSISAVLPLPETVDTRSLRADYPRVVAALVEAGATALVFDVTMLAPTEHDDALAAAFAAARDAGTPVILPRLLRDGRWAQVASDALRESTVPGLIVLEQDLFFNRIRRAPVRLRADDGSTAWHATVQALAAHLDAEPELHGDLLQVGVTRNPVPLERLWLPPVAMGPTLDWRSPGDGARGRVVLIGSTRGPSDVFSSPMGRRYGVEIHAALVETLGAQAGLRRTRPVIDGGLALATTLMTGLMALALPRRRRWLSLGVSAFVLGGFLLALGAGWLLAPVPVVLAGLCGWYAAREA